MLSNWHFPTLSRSVLRKLGIYVRRSESKLKNRITAITTRTWYRKTIIVWQIDFHGICFHPSLFVLLGLRNRSDSLPSIRLKVQCHDVSFHKIERSKTYWEKRGKNTGRIKVHVLYSQNYHPAWKVLSFGARITITNWLTKLPWAFLSPRSTRCLICSDIAEPHASRN